MFSFGLLRWLVGIGGLAVLVVWLAFSRDLGSPKSPRSVTEPRGAASEMSAATDPSREAGGSELLAVVELKDAEALTQALPAPARSVQYVRVNRPLAAGKSSPFWQAPGEGKFHFPLPEGGALSVVIDSSEMLGSDRFISTGRVEGKPGSRAVFAYNQGFLTASVETGDRALALRPATDDVSQLYEIDPALLLPCGGAKHPPRDRIVARDSAEIRQSAGIEEGRTGEAAPAVLSAISPRSEIHMLMLYTPAVKSTMSGAARIAALQSEFDAAIAKMNNELASSQVSARMKLVGIAETSYSEAGSEPSKVQDDALTAAYKTDDGKMDDIHALRDRFGADVVCIALGRSDSVSQGLSFVLDTPTSVNASAATANALYAFAIIDYTRMAGTSVVAHEMGHVLGCAHARGDAGTGTDRDGAYSYSYGYRFFGKNGLQYRDIMAYSPGTQLPYFSNPDVTAPSPISVAMGVSRGTPGEADCAHTIDRNAFEVASYRLQAQALPAGTLVNVSTRAFVGTGDAVLIGGFVVEGAGTKRILVRAAGPALRGFGVSDALANPTLRLLQRREVNGVATDVEVGRNDNWGDPDGLNVLQAVQDAGAFPFGTGSLDSAVVMPLNPGPYTAIVEGGGTSGSALVEVYDADRRGNKIINLSTRGYADKGRELFAGFVVTGGSGEMKRILIRVLGPTLARYGVNDAMHDPLLEVHSQESGLLMKNDDWSSGTVDGTVSPENDFKPLVKYYTEQQISATGLAPSNRREPCIMLDLPPGSYSAVVQPFESLTSTPTQPARPGVTIVEVYEIAR